MKWWEEWHDIHLYFFIQIYGIEFINKKEKKQMSVAVKSCSVSIQIKDVE